MRKPGYQRNSHKQCHAQRILCVDFDESTLISPKWSPKEKFVFSPLSLSISQAAMLLMTMMIYIIGTEGALRLPTTYDNQPHPIQSNPHIAVKTTSPLNIYSNQSTNDYQ